MNTFDSSILTFFNQFSQHSWAFDRAILFLSGCQLFKGGVLVTLIWWLGFNQIQNNFLSGNVSYQP